MSATPSNADALDTLEGVSRTLLLPLFARANVATLLSDLQSELHDTVARQVISGSRLALRDVSRDMFPMRLCISRTILLERALMPLLQAKPQRTIFLLACGLDTLPQRMATQGFDQLTWHCGDLAEVMAIRRQILPATNKIHHHDISLPDKLEALREHLLNATEPIVILEGILPYLTKADVAHSLQWIAEQCPQGGELFVDSYHPALLAFAKRGSTFRRGKMQATFQFSLAHPTEYNALSHRLKHREHWDILDMLPWYYQKRCVFPRFGAGRNPLATVAHLHIQAN